MYRIFFFEANITVLPRTPDSGISIIGHAEHSFKSNSADNGFINVQYIQDKDKTGSSLKIDSECASIAGVFHLSTENHVNFYLLDILYTEIYFTIIILNFFISVSGR